MIRSVGHLIVHASRNVKNTLRYTTNFNDEPKEASPHIIRSISYWNVIRYSPTQHVNAIHKYILYVFCAQGCATVCVCTHILVLNHVDKLATILANYIPTDIQHFQLQKKCINIVSIRI